MGANTGQYTRGGNPAAMFAESNLYLELLCQAQKAAIDSDFNDIAYSRITQMRRIIQNAVGDGSPNNGFKIAQSSLTTTNNFKVTGGDGTDEGGGRIFAHGLPCFLKSDVDYRGAFNALMKKIMPEVTAVSALVLTDSSANWIVNEHVGKTLTPDITVPGTTFTVQSNTVNTITVTAGNLTTATTVRKFYRIELSTPGAPRTDEVYLDVFLDEQDDIEDPNFINPDLTPPQSGPLRLVLRQFIRIVEGGFTPSPWTDSDGRPHFPLRIATIDRNGADPTVTTPMITDRRRVFVPGVSSLTLETVGLGVVIPNVSAIIVSPGTLTDLGGGVAQLSTGGGGGGAVTGAVSRQILLLNDIPAVTPPSPGVLGTDISTQDFPHGSTTGQYIEFTVPDDYDSGDLTVDVVYAMSTAVGGPNNKVRIQTHAEIAKVLAGTIDTTTYPQAPTTLTVNVGTDVKRITIKTLGSGTFGPGDRIAVEFRRLGGDVNDLHTGNWRVIGVLVGYIAQIANRAMVQATDILDDTSGVPTTPSSIGDIQTEDYPFGVDAEQKCTFIIPDSWDGISDALFRVDYAMSTALSGQKVRLQLSGQIANVLAGTVDTISPITFDILPPNDADAPHRSLVIASLLSTVLAKGDHITFKVKRLNSGVPSNHTGSFKLINISMLQGQTPTSGFTLVRIMEQFLEKPDFGSLSGTLTIDDGSFPNFATDFESYNTFVGGVSGGSVDAAFPGRLASDGSKIDTFKLNLKGTGTAQYRIRVYAEGSGNTPVYDSGTLSAPGSMTTVTILDTDLSAQPTAGLKRFFLVVTVTLAASDTFSVSRPFVRQE